MEIHFQWVYLKPYWIDDQSLLSETTHVLTMAHMEARQSNHKTTTIKNNFASNATYGRTP